MYKLNFNKPIHVHFIGIGGISMSGLAEILLEEGFTISGSDSKESDLTRALASKGATIFYGQKASNIIPGINVVVYTAQQVLILRSVLGESFLRAGVIFVSEIPRCSFPKHANTRTVS